MQTEEHVQGALLTNRASHKHANEISDIATNPNAKARVKTVISMSYNLGMRVSAEDVETDEQLAFLTKQGCDETQPFLFSPPLPTVEFEHRLQ